MLWPTLTLCFVSELYLNSTLRQSGQVVSLWGGLIGVAKLRKQLCPWVYQNKGF